MPTTLKDFESVFPKLVDDLSAQCKQYNLPANALEWYEKVIRSTPYYGPDRPSNAINSPYSTTPSAENVTAASPSPTRPRSFSQTPA